MTKKDIVKYKDLMRENPSLVDEWRYSGLMTDKEIKEIKEYRPVSLIEKIDNIIEVFARIPLRVWVVAITGVIIIAIILTIFSPNNIGKRYERLQDTYQDYRK